MNQPDIEKLLAKHHAAIEELMNVLSREFISLTVQTTAGPVTFEPARA